MFWLLSVKIFSIPLANQVVKIPPWKQEEDEEKPLDKKDLELIFFISKKKLLFLFLRKKNRGQKQKKPKTSKKGKKVFPLLAEK